MTSQLELRAGMNYNDTKHSAMDMYTISPYLNENIPLLEAPVHCLLAIANTSLDITVYK